MSSTLVENTIEEHGDTRPVLAGGMNEAKIYAFTREQRDLLPQKFVAKIKNDFLADVSFRTGVSGEPDGYHIVAHRDNFNGGPLDQLFGHIRTELKEGTRSITGIQIRELIDMVQGKNQDTAEEPALHGKSTSRGPKERAPINIISAYEPQNEAQAEFADLIRSKTVVIATGPAGTSKSHTAIAILAEKLAAGEIERIIISRPALEAGERLGFLPGTAGDKVAPFVAPIMEILLKILGPEQLKTLTTDGDESIALLPTISIIPFAFMRGRTLNAGVLADEIQNATPEMAKTLMTRLGKGCLVFNGDKEQSDLYEVSETSRRVGKPREQAATGLDYLLKLAEFAENAGSPNVAVAKFGPEHIVRSEIVAELVRYDAQYQAWEAEQRERKPTAFNANAEHITATLPTLSPQTKQSPVNEHARRLDA